MTQHNESYSFTPMGDRFGAAGIPDAIEASAVADTRRLELGRRLDSVAFLGRGVEWVRPRDLIARGGSRLAGAGINFQAQLSHRARQLTPISACGRAERIRRLPPLSAFGRGNIQQGLERGTVGAA